MAAFEAKQIVQTGTTCDTDYGSRCLSKILVSIRYSHDSDGSSLFGNNNATSKCGTIELEQVQWEIVSKEAAPVPGPICKGARFSAAASRKPEPVMASTRLR